MMKESKNMKSLSSLELNAINGGVISEIGKQTLIRQVIEPAKKNGHSKEFAVNYAIENLPALAGEDYGMWNKSSEEEIVGFINDHWDVY